MSNNAGWDKTMKWAYTYDGSSTWSIGPAADPQDAPRLTIFDRDDDRARALARILCEALNEGRLVIKDREIAEKGPEQ